jgi:GTP cyclohydrolase FolE2
MLHMYSNVMFVQDTVREAASCINKPSKVSLLTSSMHLDMHNT